MKLKTLENTSIQNIVKCTVGAFSDYSIRMPDQVEYFQNRWNIANVDYGLSVGAFQNEKFLGLIIHGIQIKQGKKIAYNALTGVIPEFRGQKIPLKLYTFIISRLKNHGIDECQLEVLQDNEKAIHVYRQVGFTIDRSLLSFQGKTQKSFSSKLVLKSLDVDSYFENNHDKKTYSWDFDKYALYNGRDVFQFYKVFFKGEEVGRFALERNKKQLAQIHGVEDSKENYQMIFSGISQLISEIKMINIDASETKFIAILQKMGLKKFVSQYEMVMDL